MARHGTAPRHRGWVVGGVGTMARAAWPCAVSDRGGVPWRACVGGRLSLLCCSSRRVAPLSVSAARCARGFFEFQPRRPVREAVMAAVIYSRGATADTTRVPAWLRLVSPCRCF
ncbi:hypothetical protein E2562_030283 [Oryza meyeriana var. granulata]|uniref:Uncharacterized protein n=1 Tax=Oryza meyeriana var. granulata TaxID=110450 RepID=A0A6G1EZL2_9ORYZ|nr:hypothetical protein E2562_030283 [Oryza meyeriana var. granulata]